MNHLSGIDAAFLHLESPEMPMHVGSLNVLELPTGYEGDFFEDVKACLAERLHLADVFTRKLALMPFDLSNPVWVEDEDIDLEHHIRHITLPKPGSNTQLQQYVARLHSTLLDRSRPLWEFFVIDGLRSGEVALYIKVHHARLDGQAGVALGRALFDTTPEGRPIKPPRPRARQNRYQLGVAELLGAALSNTAQQVVKLVKTLPAMGRAAATLLLPEKDENGRRHWRLPKDLNFMAGVRCRMGSLVVDMMDVMLRIRSGCLIAIVCTIMPPIDIPAMWAPFSARASIRPTTSSAMSASP